MCTFCGAEAQGLPGDGQTNDLTAGLKAGLVLGEGADAPANTSTPYMMDVGGRFNGSIGGAGDVDWVGIDLVAGQTYVFTMFGQGGQTLGVDNTMLALHAANGTLLTSNNDVSASNQFSAITFTATTTGRYYLAASAVGGEQGQYVIQAASNTYSLDQVVSQLTEFGWGRPTVLAFTSPSITVNLTGLTYEGKQLAMAALEAWEAFTGLRFTVTTSASAQIRFDDANSGAWAGPAQFFVDSGNILYSTVNVGLDWLSNGGTQLNTHTFMTYIHEIGHALGLYHAGQYDGAGVTAGSRLFVNDSTQMTVMSYFTPDQNPDVHGSRWTAVTPMIADIAAIEALYGSAGPVHAGNTVWGANSNVGGHLGRVFAYIFGEVAPDGTTWAPTSSPFDMAVGMTIRDTGGIDTLNLSPVAQNQRVDLTPGAVSDVWGAQGNLVIYTDTIIENVLTGAGNDHIRGNDADNRITPGRGNDTVFGGNGHDTVVIGATRAATTVTAIAGGFRLSGPDGVDEIYGVETFVFQDVTLSAAQLLAGAATVITGTAASDTLRGGNGPDLIEGHGGDDRLEGGDGNDTIHGGDGNDQILGQAGDDLLYGGGGHDVIAASDGNDTVYGGDGNDSIGGGLGNDLLHGDAGNDTIGGGQGNDTIYGGDGRDLLSGGFGHDRIYGGADNDTIASGDGNDWAEGGDGDDDMGGGFGNDTLDGGAGNDTIGGGLGDDLLYGGDGHDFLAGGAGMDTLYGGTGNDTLNGGPGNDLLYGGLGADIFVFNLTQMDGPSTDRIADFEDGVDRIRIAGLGGSAAAQFAALEITAVAGGAQVRLGDLTILVDDIAPSQLTLADFIFS